MTEKLQGEILATIGFLGGLGVLWVWVGTPWISIMLICIVVFCAGISLMEK